MKSSLFSLSVFYYHIFHTFSLSESEFEDPHRHLVDFSTPVVQYVSPSEGIPHHWYGASVYVGDGVAIVGASGDSDYSKYGNAYVLKNQDGLWVEVAKLTPTSPNLDDGFGSAVSIYLGFALVGAYRDDTNGEDSGCVYYFTEENGWLQQQKIIPSDGSLLDYFGSSLAQFRRQSLVIGAWGVDYGDYTSCGAAYFYRFSNNQWVLDQKIFAHDIHSYQWFGISVSIYQTKAAIGAWGDSEDGTVAGAVYTYDYTNQQWTEIQKLLLELESSHMGYAVAMFEDVLGVGLPNSYRTEQGTANNPNAFRTGMVAVYRLMDYNHWEFEQFIQCSECNDLMSFGSILSVSKENILIGMHGGISLWRYNPYETTGYRWSEHLTVSTLVDDLDTSYFYGSALSIRDNVVMIGVKTADSFPTTKKNKMIQYDDQMVIEEGGMLVILTSPNVENNAPQTYVVDENMDLYVALYIIISIGLMILLVGPLILLIQYLYADDTTSSSKQVELKPLVKGSSSSSSSNSSRR